MPPSRCRSSVATTVVALHIAVLLLVSVTLPASAQTIEDLREVRDDSAEAIERHLSSSELVLPGTPIDRPEVDLDDHPLADLLPDSELFHPNVMAQVRLDLGRAEPIAIEIATSQLERSEAMARRAKITEVRRELFQDRWGQGLIVRDRADAVAEAEADLSNARDDVAAYGLQTFVEFEELEVHTSPIEDDVSPIPELRDSAEDVLTHRLHAARAALGRARAALAEAEDRHGTIAAHVVQAQERIDVARADEEAAAARIAEHQPLLEDSLAQRPVVGTDLTGVVLDAYYNAQILMAERRPECGVTWDQLAGIGLIETRHGTFGGNTVNADGQTSGVILGPELNGDPFAAISDTDGGALDGNPVWDHAVGPMQFIPGSWRLYSLDGNGDGEHDPHNMYDAAFAAAEHLCRSISGLQADANFRVALFGYNRSEEYGIAVMGARAHYRQAVDL